MMSETVELILRVSEILAAIALIIGMVQKVIKPFKALCKQVDKIDRHETENYLSTLRLTICSEEIPLEERIAAGDKYIKLGGNGAVKHKYEQLIEQLDKQ